MIKCVCSCSNNLLKEKGIAHNNVCNKCNRMVCDDCIEICKCISCHNTICQEHSVRCQLCDLRLCKETTCLHAFKSCDTCRLLFCDSHFKEHSEFSKSNALNIKCNAIKFKANSGAKHANIDYISQTLRNIGFLSEISFRTSINRKQRARRFRH